MIIPVLIGVTFIVFSLTYISPGDPARMILPQDATDADIVHMRHLMGLDEPFFMQYIHFLFGSKARVKTAHSVTKDFLPLIWADHMFQNRPVFKTILNGSPIQHC
jgi:ABC-type dipeptide/oligopeptide/nickel transport system permease component